ncbi:DUF2235 domain-containing protein [Aurantimonas endophytica]|uniref:Uncharacterized protein (DUF2235 family) n=1 Tax=Aurantimonas endophytica TaxID=1522175 RepID=A0A7W6MQC4_9HYPH|nr:DUF2235 domain-containing protein [Aurantimonas endophytica]MBB4003799.1 uncharacterized protein (DUF2235 family) [Aurantimonas endophytica]MCO6404653.1 DUF2235 domain-containing protein [Aurantimonas endophytica]
MRKRLVVCFDGTWNNADDSDKSATNVQRIARAVRGNSGDMQQIVLYLRGVGSTGTQIQRLLAGATGAGVEDNIRSAYMFLAQNYRPARKEGGKDVAADEIFLFGFSRGAFSARSLAGFISSAGLLKRQRLADLPAAWAYYRRVGPRSSKDFCAVAGSDCHHDPEITFVGVWDTVGALGIPKSIVGLQIDASHEFHDTTPSKIVANAFHALAIDEYRDEFVPTLWTGTVPAGAHVEQCWFAGAHSDVGGGYADRRLADIPLAWMAGKAEQCGLALQWEDEDRPAEPLLRADASLDPYAPQHESRFNLSRKDRLTPTIRQIHGASFRTSLLERAYFPTDGEGRPLKPLNESVHSSAVQRVGKTVAIILNDDGDTQRRRYAPKNLAAALRR